MPYSCSHFATEEAVHSSDFLGKREKAEPFPIKNIL